MNFQDYFIPNEKVKVLRSNQLEACDALSKLISLGKRRIELEAPPGSGKSELAKLIMNYFESEGMTSLVCSPQNLQVDQYKNMVFDGLRTLKGRVHYPCLNGRENASKGFCITKHCPDGKTKRTKDNCITRGLSMCRNCLCRTCIYSSEFRKFRESAKGNTNLTLAIMGITNSPHVWIIDEADTLEKELRNFRSGVFPFLFKDPKFPGILKELHDFISTCQMHIDSIKSESNTEAQIKQIEEYESYIDYSWLIINDYEEYKEPWCVSAKPVSQKTKLEPITITRFLERLFKDTIVIMMSATPPHYPAYEKIVVQSSFPIETRQWQYAPQFGSMTSSCRDKTIPKLAIWLSQLKGKTMFHARAYETGVKLKGSLQNLGKTCLLQGKVNDDTAKYNRYNVVEAFLTSKNPDELVILTNQTRGLDLWQPDVINNVLTMPWVNPTEPITICKDALLGKGWRDQEMANEIAQTIARHFRNEKKGIYKGVEVPKRAYMTDASFGNWYSTHKHLFPKNFVESERL